MPKKPRKIAGSVAMLGATLLGAGTPAVVTDSKTVSTRTTIESQRQAPAKTAAGTMQTQRANSGTSRALFDGFGGLYRGWNQRPFAPWEAPRYNQRKARRRARQMGRKVSRT